MDNTMNGKTLNTEPAVEVQPKQREQWSRQLDFFLSCLGYAIGLGNVWRFPYLCYKNGGGAFLIPYILMLAFCGLPVFFMELSLGQYHGKGPNILFKHLSPAFRGIGYAMVVVSFLVSIYYNVIMTWSIFYMIASFDSTLGWSTCNNVWNTKACYVPKNFQFCPNFAGVNVTCSDNICTAPNGTSWNIANCPYFASDVQMSSSEEYFLYYVLGISKSIEDIGILHWKLVLYLFLAWVIVALCLIKGVRSSGKVVYFTAIFPFVVLVILFFRGVTLPGASSGIYFYIVPKWSKLLNIQTWADAAVQIFYSLGLAFGGLLTLSSYNKFRNNCYRDAIVVAVTNCGTSVFSGFVIFSILGYMAHSINAPVENIVKSGTGLAFIAYPDAVMSMPLSQLWAVLFFFMLITLGLDSQFAMCETVITAASDEWPALRCHKSKLVLGVCVVCFLLGLPLCAEGGIYYFTLLDTFAASWPLLIIGLFELIIVSWIYGTEKYKLNISEMIDRIPNNYWIFCWKFVSPLTIMGILLFTVIHYQPASFGKYQLPLWANALGWLMAGSSIIMIPAFVIYQIYRNKSQNKSLKTIFQPTEEWGPSTRIPPNPVEATSLECKDKNSTYSNPAFTEDNT